MCFFLLYTTILYAFYPSSSNLRSDGLFQPLGNLYEQIRMFAKYLHGHVGMESHGLHINTVCIG